MDVDCETCARCGQTIPRLKTGSLLVPHRPGELVVVISGNHFNPVAYRPNPSREYEDICEP